DPGRSLDLNLHTSSTILEKNDELDPGTQLSFAFSAEDEIPGWIDNATLDLEILSYGVPTLDISFGTLGSLVPSISCVKATTCSSFPIPIYIKTNNTPVDTYDVTIRGVATQTSPFFTTGNVDINLQIKVVDKKPWFKTVDGDIAAKGDLVSVPPITTLVSNQEGEWGQVIHDGGCVFIIIVCLHPNQPSSSKLLPLNPGRLGVLDRRPGGQLNVNRLYLTFDTPLGAVRDARFKFVVDGLENTPNTTFGIYKIPSISWTDATFASSGSADVLWNATTEAIHLNGEPPRFTFNTTDDLPPTGQTFEIIVDKGLIDQGTTQWILAWTGESTWHPSIKQMHYLQLQFQHV
ncbi:MAG: hypothetical protein IIB06_04790, partial [Bacteroidetes bacterium]|nr:hypothetical protein [Bacteroidota bacterium]